MEARTPSWLPSGLLFGGLVLMFVSQRVLSAGTNRNVVLVVTGLLLAFAFVQRLANLTKARGDARKVEWRLLAASIGVLAALLFYALSTRWGLQTMGLTGPAAERAAGTFQALFAAVLMVSGLGLLFMELSYARMPVAEAVEVRRVSTAAQAGMSFGLALVFLFSMNYVTAERDVKRDLSYFRTSQPSEATKNMVRALGAPLEVTLIYPPVNEVLEAIKPYFEELDAESDQLTVQTLDHALAPKLVREHRIRNNGYVLLVRDEGEAAKGESFSIGTDLAGSRNNLKSLDERFQRAMSKLMRPPRSIFFTGGHGEHDATSRKDQEPEDRLHDLETLLKRFNISTAKLGLAQGLAKEVPEDARAVAVMGPREPFLPEEAESLLRFVRRGGRVLLALDPDTDHGLEPMLSGLGLELEPGVLVCESEYIRRTFTPADKANVHANQYSSHPTVTSVGRARGQVGTIFVQGGALSKTPDAVPGVKISTPLHSANDCYRDLNGNFTRDPDEKAARQSMIVAATVSVEDEDENAEGRVVVVADGDFATDKVLRNAGNTYVMVDVLRWLIGDEQIQGELTSEEDVPIEHSKEGDRLWFYATTFGLPLPILAIGAWTRRRRDKRSEKRS
jgi:hypothetical protein